MKCLCTIFYLFFLSTTLAQENESDQSDVTQQVEDLAEDNIEADDETHFLQMEYLRKHPININKAEASDLQELRMLTALQIHNFISYRNLLGAFLSIYELQSIPSWDVLTIKKLLPYINVGDSKKLARHVRERMLIGEQTLMFRFSIIQQKSKGFIRNDSSGTSYLGSRPGMLVRYKYNYKNLLQYGFLGDKDAGEQFLKGAQKQGFDFYSLHFFIRDLGMIKSLALGDFTVNLGQGLIHWQSLAFKKSAAAISIKRQSDVLRPYGSSGEFNFHRGAAISLRKNRWETTIFASVRKLSATIKTDTLQNSDGYISSLLTAGYHRTANEIGSRNNIQAIAGGGNIKYGGSGWHMGLNIVQHHFSRQFKASDKPYDLFAIEGKQWGNQSLDYSYTFRNLHLFGEIATDKNHHTAFLNGIIASIDRSLDLALLYRNIPMQYQSLSGNAFTENALPTNEKGMYVGISLRPLHGLKIDTHADFFKFPWLKFSADAPGYGTEYLMQMTYTPKKEVELSVRYKKETKQLSENGDQTTSPVITIPRQSLRAQISFRFNREIIVRSRTDLLWYGQEPDRKERGYLIYAEIHYKSPTKPVSGNTRLQYFETDSYTSRLYAYENDVLYSSGIPAIFDKGFRWYINVRTDVSRLVFPYIKVVNAQTAMRYAITRYSELSKIGSGMDEIQGNLRSEFRFSLIFTR